MSNKELEKNEVFVRTFGCQMNVRDSEIISGLLRAAGYKIALTDKEAKIIIFNTCAVRQHAEDRVWSLIGSYKGTKIIGLVGCMAQNYQERAFDRDASVSFVIGPQDIHKLPEVLSKITHHSLLERKVWETQGSIRPEEIYRTGFHQDQAHTQIVISEGCSNFCSYCVVPYVRGPLRHRKFQSIIEEIRSALDSGISRITLLGQNVNAYQDGDLDFTKLLKAVNALNGLEELGFFTSHPKDVHLEFFKAINELDKLTKTLHLPVQSGADRILKLMNRGYTRKDYLAKVTSYRKIVEGGTLTTDIIVGFPTESKDEFEETKALISEVGFNGAYIFKYSPRPNTQASKIVPVILEKEIQKRHLEILNLQRAISNKLKHKHAKK